MNCIDNYRFFILRIRIESFRKKIQNLSAKSTARGILSPIQANSLGFAYATA